ncbi:hypothetical protein GYMLUDRAFT_48304 [Collybiopsis luxurians FD-317 M1]|uniref:Uncharacterized protein n=1 Tax=Collybiopsis luxurians FD-317 M1 TaxID=944289 RepID=A0A0D0CIW3_9AGAR|nr:hypothetical protein GYMLUDRAFT_48304 [Collybiopsis luxurians FD-317 M1]
MDLYSTASNASIRSALALSAASIAAYIFTTRRNRRVSHFASIQTLNSRAAPVYDHSVPVAVFLGGTAGIGRGMAEAFARITNGNAHIILLGRNEAAAQAIISTFPKPTLPGARHEFIRCDATLMTECERTIRELRSRLPKINFLVLSPMFVRTLAKEETVEGKEPKLVLMYYARFKFAKELMPALESAKAAGEDAKVFIVGGAGLGKYIDWDDLGLKRGYSFFKIRRQFPMYLDVMLQVFADRSPSLTYIHAYPGPVRSALADNINWFARNLFKLVFSLSFPFSHTESGDYMLHAMLTTARSSGVWSVGMYGNVLPEGKIYQATKKERKQLWDHSVEETSTPK